MNSELKEWWDSLPNATLSFTEIAEAAWNAALQRAVKALQDNEPYAYAWNEQVGVLKDLLGDKD